MVLEQRRYATVGLYALSYHYLGQHRRGAHEVTELDVVQEDLTGPITARHCGLSVLAFTWVGNGSTDVRIYAPWSAVRLEHTAIDCWPGDRLPFFY